jgi:eukaryotic-like serine/threonine-protein kinase
MNELAGRSLGGYQLEEEIGRGSMGVVYRGKQIALGREVAVKVLPQTLARDASYIARFIREAQIIAGLNHPNIVHIYDAGQQNNLLYFVMEYIQGPTLAALLHLDGSIPQHLAVEYAAQIADALDAAYRERNVIHRDIKPENLMLNRWGNIKVMDFGLARALGYQPITVAKTLVGSIYYASPEQIWGLMLDNRSDIYALGVVLYEMVCGQRPFQGRSMQELTRTIVQTMPTPPSKLNAEISPKLENIIFGALAKDREQRYSEASLLAQDLRSLHLQPPVIPALSAPHAELNTANNNSLRDNIFTGPPRRPSVQRPNYFDQPIEQFATPIEHPALHGPSENGSQQAPSQQRLLPPDSSRAITVSQHSGNTQDTSYVSDADTASLVSQHKRRTLWGQLQRLFGFTNH